MPISVCSWSLAPESPGGLLASLGRIGISRVQLALSPLVHSPEDWCGCFDVLRSGGVDVVSGMMQMQGEDYSTLESIARTGGIRPDETWERNLAHAEQVASLATRHGVSLVTFHAGFIPEAHGTERKTLMDRLSTIAGVFKSQGVHVALETGQETAQTLLSVLVELNTQAIGVNFDSANMILYGKGDPVESLRALGTHIRQVHIKDALPTEVSGTWGREVPVGQGAVQWDVFFGVLNRIHDQIECVIEREAGASREQDIRDAAQFIVPFLTHVVSR